MEGLLAEKRRRMDALWSPEFGCVGHDVGRTNKYSSNIYAEQLLRALGGQAGESSTTSEGLG